MREAPSKIKIVLAQVAVAMMIAFVVAGVAWYGFSAEVRQRMWQNLLDRPGGPMTFRFILQPIMATIAALYDGVEDARTGRSPYLWTIIADQTKRGGRLREGLISTARVHSPGPRHGHGLSDHRAQDLLSGRGCRRRAPARIRPLPLAAWPMRAHRAHLGRARGLVHDSLSFRAEAAVWRNAGSPRARAGSGRLFRNPSGFRAVFGEACPAAPARGR